MKKHIPNIITLLNLFSGTIAITMAFQENFRAVVIWVSIAALLDFLDGFAARILKSYSDIGKQLDSLADVVSFGVAPAAALFILLREFTLQHELIEPIQIYTPYLAFLIPVFAAYRLAKFNIDHRQTESFLGLPTPANGLFWISYCYGIQTLAGNNEYLFYITIVLIFIMSLLMISEIPMFSLKIKKTGIKNNISQLILFLIAITLIVILGISGLAWGIVAYIIISVLASSLKPSKG